MDDAEFRGGQEKESGAKLLCEFPGEVEGNAAEVGVAEEVVEVVGEQLEGEAQVVAEHEVALQVDCGGVLGGLGGKGDWGRKGKGGKGNGGKGGIEGWG